MSRKIPPRGLGAGIKGPIRVRSSSVDCVKLTPKKGLLKGPLTSQRHLPKYNKAPPRKPFPLPHMAFVFTVVVKFVLRVTYPYQTNNQYVCVLMYAQTWLCGQTGKLDFPSPTALPRNILVLLEGFFLI